MKARTWQFEGSGGWGKSEDAAIFNPCFCGGIVVDGASAPFSPENPSVLFDGVTGGRMVAKVAGCAFAMASPDYSLEEILLEINDCIAEEQAGRENLAGGSFACFQIKDGLMQVITGSDAFVVLMCPSGNTFATPNQSFVWERKRIETFAEIKERCGGDSAKAWNEYFSIYRQFRKQQDGVEYASLNGLPSLDKLWCSETFLQPEAGGVLLAITDGMAVFEETENPEEFANIIRGLYADGGVEAILAHKRKDEERKAETSHVKHAEATCIEVIF